MGRYPHENEQNLIDENAILEQKIRDLEEKVTVLKAERDEHKRNVDVLSVALIQALDGWRRCATCVVEDSDAIEHEVRQIDVLEKLVKP